MSEAMGTADDHPEDERTYLSAAATVVAAVEGDSPIMDSPLLAVSGPTTLAKLRGLPWSIAGNSLNSVFAQFTFFGSVFVLFLNELGLSKSQIGLLLSILPFTSVLAIFFAPAVARFGAKRTFLTAYGTRTIVTAFLLFTPWVVTEYGSVKALQYVTIIVTVFAILRALVEIGFIPWVQEFVPNAVRGKYAAKDNIFATLAGIASIIIAGLVIGASSGLTGYIVLIGAGVLAAFVALWTYTFIPGGAPARASELASNQFTQMRNALADADYRRYLLGVSLVTLGAAAVISFLPLYLDEQVGIETGLVIWVQIGTLTGTLIFSYLWGWAADRYGSKPVMRSGAAMLAVLPILWWLIPRGAPVSLYIALGISFLQGFAGVGWIIGAGRLLHVTLVPPDRKFGYMALYSAWLGIVGGVSQLAGGWILDLTQGLYGEFGFLTIDPYTPLFLIGFVLTLSGQPALHGIVGEVSVGMREFAGLFVRGNPFMAMTSMIRNQFAQDERSSVLRTEQLGRTGSRLPVDELVQALSDPRYSVRYEAQIAISHMRRDPRLTKAMIGMLEGTELALSAQAAWALGRMGDRDAIPSLRKAMDIPYRSVRLQSIRALGWLGDQELAPTLLERLRIEDDKGLRMAYASALSNLGAIEAAPELLQLMRETENPGASMELALDIARLMGGEHLFIRLIRSVRNDAGTTAAVVLSNVKKRLVKRKRRTPQEAATLLLLDGAIESFAAEDIGRGSVMLAELLSELSLAIADSREQLIVTECASGLSETEGERIEYLVLALHLINTQSKAFLNRSS